MSIVEIVANAKGKDPEAVEAGLASLRQMADQYAAKTNAALDAYFQREEDQENAIRSRLGALEGDLRTVSRRIDAIGPALMAATVAGDNNALGELQAQLSDLENQRATISTQIKMLNEAPFPHEKALYDAIITARVAERRVLEKIGSARRELCAYAQAMENAWNAVYQNLSRSINTSTKRQAEKVAIEFTSAESTHDYLCRREKEKADAAARAEARGRWDARKAELDREEAERQQRELANRPEYRNVQTPGRVIRQKLNHETGEYEDIGSQSNAV